MTIPMLAEKAGKLPLEPGVYLMKDKTGQIIYIGKAKKLKNRVSSYFHSVDKHLPKVYQMVMHVSDFDFIVAGSEFEALVLECSLIKQYSPKYNILLKDDKGYHYVKITPGPWPDLQAAKQKIDDGSTYIGPYTSSFVVTQSVELAKKVFMLPGCKKKFPQDIGKERPCLNYHIKQCCGVCTGKISCQEYNDRVQRAVDYITVGADKIVKDLEREMTRLAESMEFEKAAAIRDQLQSLRRLNERQKVVFESKVDMDAISVAKGGTAVCAVVLKFRRGRLSDKDEFLLKDDGTPVEILNEFVARYYTTRQDMPKEVLLELEIPDAALLAQLMGEKRGSKVSVLVPQRGEKRQLVQMAYDNAVTGISYRSRRSSREVAGLDELAKLLGLGEPPAYIESYDISNLGESYKVCGMVVFRDGKPYRRAYKRFKIQTVDGQDDYASMREVLTRRLTRLKNGDSDDGFATTPDLILLDGGEGHVAAIRPIVQQLGLSIPVFGMVKDSKHRTRAIALGGQEVALSSYKAAFKLVTTIQDEVHRYAISYQRKLHKNSALKSELTNIPGVGEKRAKALLTAFRSLEEISLADVQQLMDRGKLPKKAALAVYDYFNGK
ncbi:excinuclease ABC subunit UvrC [Neobittarella massiliensis]|uniref:UvrABC system protein C n=1 Tax=uncultured Anaerotruncus sp. TaxID=905011 RepID=A0A1C6K6V3_9FIRM|nr:excinuclease ABC subunit UvrC [Neobittarella massiliensis]SCJ89685.1 Excinuclease ABC subunit C [uncultured Anaerotruncus sp.]